MTNEQKTIFVTGAAGFIGSAVCRYLRDAKIARVIGIDKMTYAATQESLACLAQDKNFELIEADVGDFLTMETLFKQFKPDAVMHLAAETHVDRSIDNASTFIHTNIVGTYILLETARHYFEKLPADKREAFRFLHISTDEVYGSLGANGQFSETTPYAPNSPYAASKASADHLARAWYKTYGLPVVISNCSNNYGPFQFPEKLIPLCISKALKGEKLPIYGQGLNIRDWLFVEDHAEALYLILTKGRLGEKYNVGGGAERRNIDLVTELCSILDRLCPASSYAPHKQLITFVADRPGHDERYAIDFSKLKNELGWAPRTSFSEGLEKTVGWYLNNSAWTDMIHARNYAGQRLGLSQAGKK